MVCSSPSLLLAAGKGRKSEAKMAAAKTHSYYMCHFPEKHTGEVQREQIIISLHESNISGNLASLLRGGPTNDSVGCIFMLSWLCQLNQPWMNTNTSSYSGAVDYTYFTPKQSLRHTQTCTHTQRKCLGGGGNPRGCKKTCLQKCGLLYN